MNTQITKQDDRMIDNAVAETWVLSSCFSHDGLSLVYRDKNNPARPVNKTTIVPEKTEYGAAVLVTAALADVDDPPTVLEPDDADDVVDDRDAVAEDDEDEDEDEDEVVLPVEDASWAGPGLVTLKKLAATILLDSPARWRTCCTLKFWRVMAALVSAVMAVDCADTPLVSTRNWA